MRASPTKPTRVTGPASPASAHRDRDALHQVVPHPLQIPRLLQWLGVAGGIRRTARQHVLPRRCIPRDRPGAPRERSQRLVQRRLAPGTVYADLDTDDRCPPRPCPTADLDAPPIEP